MSDNPSIDYSRHMLIGYARVSTPDQVLDHQIDALMRAGVARENIHTDIASGAKASRPNLDLVLQLVRAGDTLVITRLDRLGRSVLHLVTLGAQLRERDVGLKVTEQGIDTATAEGRAMFGMLSVLAELQRELIVANTRDGLSAARARGRLGGRRPALSQDQAALAQRLYDAGEHTVQQIADIVRVPRSTVYGHLTPTSRAGAALDAGPEPDPGAPAVATGTPGEPRPAEPEAVPAPAPGRVVDLTVELGATAGGRTWHLAETETGSGLWLLHRDSVHVASVQRSATRTGRRGWRARLGNGVELRAHGDLAVGGSTLWRSRDLAAAGLALHLKPTSRAGADPSDRDSSYSG